MVSEDPGGIWAFTTARGLSGQVEGRKGAPWLTCLHSLATDLHLWDPQVEVLSRHFRLLRLDMRGHGSSLPNGASATIDELRDDVVSVWDELDIERSSVLGLSIGGMIALSLALRVPDRATRIVAADCRADAPQAFRDMWEQRQALLQDGGMGAIVDATLPTWFTASTLEQRPAYLKQVADMIASTSRTGYLAATRALQELALLPLLGTMTRPVLYLVGEADGPHPQAMSGMQGATPGSTLQILPGAAHLSNLEQTELFNAAILPFLCQPAPAATV